MVYDPVIADLNRYLNKLDLEEARAEAIDEIIDDWMRDRSKVEEALEELWLESELQDVVVEAIMSGKYDRLGNWFVNYVRQTLEESAAKEFDQQVKQALQDKAEAKVLWRGPFDE